MGWRLSSGLRSLGNGFAEGRDGMCGLGELGEAARKLGELNPALVKLEFGGLNTWKLGVRKEKCSKEAKNSISHEAKARLRS